MEAAAQCYFRKDVAKLTPSQAAYLAGIINGPELYDSTATVDYTEAARARWTYVLDGMAPGVHHSWQRAEARVPQGPSPQPPDEAGGRRPDGVPAGDGPGRGRGLRHQRQDLERGGYRIYDDVRLGQDPRRGAVPDGRARAPEGAGPTGTQAAIATVDVRAAGRLRLRRRRRPGLERGHAGHRPGGSTFKPFALSPPGGQARPGQLHPQAPGRRQPEPREPGRRAAARRSSDHAGTRSTNEGNDSSGTSTSYRDRRIGEHRVRRAQRQGRARPHQGRRHLRRVPGPHAGPQAIQSNVLGTSSPHPIDVARAFATFAAQGVRHDTFVISKVVSAQTGAVIKQHNTDAGAKQVFDSGVMADATYAMQQVVKHGTATVVSRLDRPVAGKTGTITDNKAAWFAGYTPQYATVVAMYRIGKRRRTSS